MHKFRLMYVAYFISIPFRSFSSCLGNNKKISTQKGGIFVIEYSMLTELSILIDYISKFGGISLEFVFLSV